MGDTTINVERPPAHLAKIDLDSIKYTPAGEKWPHKDQCASCRMYFHRDSMITRVPNHRVVDMRKNLGVPMEGQRYILSISTRFFVCVLCTQLFDYPEEEEPTSKQIKGTVVPTMTPALHQKHHMINNEYEPIEEISEKFHPNTRQDFKKISKR